MPVLGAAVLIFSLAAIASGTVMVKKTKTEESRKAGKGLVYAGMIFAGLAMFVFSICTDRVIFEILLIQLVIAVCALRIIEEIKE